MIPGLLQLLVFQALGELLAHVLLPAVPGPVLGLLGLLAWLRLRGRIGPGLAMVADAFSANLGLLFVPAAVGVVMFLPRLRSDGAALALVLAASVVATIAVSALLLRLLSRAEPSAESDSGDEARR